MTNLHCPNCGYSLRGNVSGQCPECGERAVPDEIIERFSRFRANWAASYKLAFRVVALQSLAFVFLSLLAVGQVPPWVLNLALYGFLASTLVVSVRLAYDRAMFLRLQRTAHDGLPADPLTMILSAIIAAACVMGVQLFFIGFGGFIIFYRMSVD